MREKIKKILTKKAQKHINLNLNVKHIFNQKYPEYCVYLATHTRSPIYQELEEKSKEDFWSIKLRTPQNHRQLKDPDMIITDNYNALFLIEVKWGGIEGCSSTDLEIDITSQKKMINIRHLGGDCSIRGPATKNGRRYRTEEFSVMKNVTVNNGTQFILVSDFKSLRNKWMNWKPCQMIWRQQQIYRWGIPFPKRTKP